MKNKIHQVNSKTSERDGLPLWELRSQAKDCRNFEIYRLYPFFIFISFSMILNMGCGDRFTPIVPEGDGPDITLNIGIDSISPSILPVSDSTYLTAFKGDSVFFNGTIIDDDDLSSIQTIIYFEQVDIPISDVIRDSFSLPTEYFMENKFRLSPQLNGEYEMTIKAKNSKQQESTFTVFIEAQ
jgi:hypothetical protein